MSDEYIEILLGILRRRIWQNQVKYKLDFKKYIYLFV